MSSDGSSLAVPAFSDTGPVTRHVHHVSGVEHPVTEQMVELEASSIDCPVMTGLGVVEMIAFRRQHRQMLDVAP